MVDLFGRVPVSARQWVRHMIALPDRTSYFPSFSLRAYPLTANPTRSRQRPRLQRWRQNRYIQPHLRRSNRLHP